MEIWTSIQIRPRAIVDLPGVKQLGSGRSVSVTVAKHYSAEHFQTIHSPGRASTVAGSLLKYLLSISQDLLLGFAPSWNLGRLASNAAYSDSVSPLSYQR
jgi:hypothetical protein